MHGVTGSDLCHIQLPRRCVSQQVAGVRVFANLYGEQGHVRERVRAQTGLPDNPPLFRSALHVLAVLR